MRLHDWLRSRVTDPKYSRHIWWQNERKSILAIHWKHASFGDYKHMDSILFKSWAIQNNRYDPVKGDTAEEIKRWKTNFRCALASATNIIAVKGKDKLAYKMYQLLQKPDPKKVEMKRKSNKKAAKSKQKPQNQKRNYHSRLLKSSVKPEAFEDTDVHMKPTKRQVKNKSGYAQHQQYIPKEEPMDFMPKVEPTSHYQCVLEGPQLVMEEDLPTTLDDLHEDDGGYCSAASDCSSGYSPSSSSSSSTEHLYKMEKRALDPVETILSDRSCSSDDQLYEDMYYLDEDLPHDFEQETTINEWGQEVIFQDNDGPNVIVQKFADRSYGHYSSHLHQGYQILSGGMDDGYALTQL